MKKPKRTVARKAAPGSSPGIESILASDRSTETGRVRICCVDYGPQLLDAREINDLDAFIAKPRPKTCVVRWINVDGTHTHAVNKLRLAFGLHTLAAEDVLRPHQRPKVEEFDRSLFIVLRMLTVVDAQLEDEQVSMFFLDGTLITFQEKPGDIWDPVRKRLENPESRLRNNDVSYLLYALLDALVDQWFPILETYGNRIEDLEDEVVERAEPQLQRRIHKMKRELSHVRRVVWPTRDIIGTLARPETSEISDFTRTYLRDVYDHSVQIIDMVETHREMAGGLNDLYVSVVSNRMNEIMKVLTIMASFFIPITFIAGVYGMNFDFMPELHLKVGYPIFLTVCLSIVLTLYFYFRRRGWLGGGDHGDRDDTRH